ncbi:hypothetical protein KIN20_034257 [Parelaphostrongylus tenuis]|uniref:Uncharacterized protein n=1 Tax=Parelaphostrongylus tenuis TaxID=148309 RepID=A0AAD5WJ32_PARTN|nr:hypothetical protein KIN20_034257 [Parelaphostrongylus tenuis]
MAFTPNGYQLAIGAFQKVKIYDITSLKPANHVSPIVCFEQIMKNVTAIGFEAVNQCSFVPELTTLYFVTKFVHTVTPWPLNEAIIVVCYLPNTNWYVDAQTTFVNVNRAKVQGLCPGDKRFDSLLNFVSSAPT